MNSRRPAPTRQSGAALLLMAVLLALAGTAYFISRYSSDGAAARTVRTEDSLARAKAALIGYAASFREQVNPDRVWGYLPCPDTNNDGKSDTDFAQCPSAPGQNLIGRLPFITLGLPDLRDESAECLWYVVSGTHKTQNSTSAMNWDLRGNIRIVDADGGVLADPDDAEGGAVLAIIAPGPPLSGQDRSGSGAGPCAGGTSNAITSFLDVGTYASPTPSPLELRVGRKGAADNNDRIVWVTAKELFGPLTRRSDLLGNMPGRLQACLNSQFTLPRPTAGNMTRNGATDPKWQVTAAGLDEILNSGALAPACSWGNDFTADLWEHWRDHARYVFCDNGTACLTVGASACTGVLLFAGKNLNGAPRTSAEKTITGYFEDPNRASLTGTGTAFAGGSAYAPGDPPRDLALCLNPASSAGLSFANDFGTLTDVRFGSFGVNGDKTITLVTNPDPTQNTLVLGDRDLSTSGSVPSSQLFGCSWFGSSLPFGQTLRAHFQYRIEEEGNGFVFVLADAPSDVGVAPQNPSPTMCGSSASGRLGYAGTAPNPDGGLFPAINHPKIGLEIDTSGNAATNNDPNGNHAAFVFWGAPGNLDDDNTHGAGAGTPTSPSNPSGSPGLGSAGFIDNNNRTLHVRLEIQRGAKAGDTRSYTLTAWILKDTLPAGFTDLTTDFGPSEEAAIPDPGNDLLKIGPLSVAIADLAPGSDALRNIWVGFTTSSTNTQEVRITNFTLRTENE